MNVLDVLDMTGRAARRFKVSNGCLSFEKPRVVTPGASAARKVAINLGAHIASLVTAVT